MKKFVVLIGLLLLFSPASSAFDLEDFLEGSGNGSPATGLNRIQSTILANQNGGLDRFLSGTDTGGRLVGSPVQAIIDDFTEKGLGNGTNDIQIQSSVNDLPFFSGGGTGLFNVPQDDNSSFNPFPTEDENNGDPVDGDDADPFAWPDDDWGWFYLPSNSGTWFDSGSWGSGSTQ